MKGSKETNEKVTYTAKVTRAHQFDEKNVSFDMVVCGITISQCRYIEYVTKEGKPGSMIAFPQHQGKDGKWYNYVWFPISHELKDDIVKQLEAMV